jgi:hypothetical protein
MIGRILFIASQVLASATGRFQGACFLALFIQAFISDLNCTYYQWIRNEHHTSWSPEFGFSRAIFGHPVASAESQGIVTKQRQYITHKYGGHTVGIFWRTKNTQLVSK